MFTPPPNPPKDYIIKDVTKSLQSSSQFTPDAECRVTQTNLAKFCSPIEYEDNEIPEKTIKEIESSIMQKMVMDARAEWIAAPGKDDFLLHDVYHKYSMPQMNYDPRFRDMQKPFNRSYKYELDCVEAARLDKLRVKVEKEMEQTENGYLRLAERKRQREEPKIDVQSCKFDPPFWWKRETQQIDEHMKMPETGKTTYQMSYPKRWQEKPNLTAYVKDDPCLRRKEMHIVGQPFRNEACNWYYRTYPPPNIKFKPKKFI